MQMIKTVKSFINLECIVNLINNNKIRYIEDKTKPI